MTRNRKDEHHHGKDEHNHGKDDFHRVDLSQDQAIARDYGDGDDTVSIRADRADPQVRLTFTSSEVGNGNARDSNTMLNQDGGLAVRAQAEDNSGALAGPVSRFDDEGITFESKGKFTFDVRDLVSGVERGDRFDTVELGTRNNDTIDESGAKESYYINAGMGNDVVTGGRNDDFLVGGAGSDHLNGKNGNDSFIGGGGDDTILGQRGKDVVNVNVATDGSDTVDLGKDADTVNVVAPVSAQQIRLTFTSSEVGNDSAHDGGTMPNQDGGLAVRLQAEDGAGNLTGPVSRFDDEGISFASATPGVTYDVRDLVSGVQRGDRFDAVELGTKDDDKFNKSGEENAYYINAGMGDDMLVGGLGNDFLVGGAGNDHLNGREGKDSLIGGGGSDVFVFSGDPGSDSILDFVSGADKIDFSAYGIDFGDVQTIAEGANTLIRVDLNHDRAHDFQVTLLNSASPAQTDYLFG
ncbi:calcium-binding protein [Azospirillum sp. SYSU D00513]|uniref:calcium-binding protein n=1 Tax=Azospirillum sp. SYSU D00513 TaxID=2812561 RepID=UPI001A97D0C6|nr:calcium-binding protein [Azospirillum sp. SYSU D00513]